MSWTLKGKSQSDKVEISGLYARARIGAWDGTTLWGVGYDDSTTESYYRVRNGRLDAQIIFPSTTALLTPPTASTFCVYASADYLPKPKDLSSQWRVYGYAHHTNFGGYGSDLLMQYNHNMMGTGLVAFEFLLANQGSYQTLNNTNMYQVLGQFFGTYGGIAVNLEYDI